MDRGERRLLRLRRLQRGITASGGRGIGNGRPHDRLVQVAFRFSFAAAGGRLRFVIVPGDGFNGIAKQLVDRAGDRPGLAPPAPCP